MQLLQLFKDPFPMGRNILYIDIESTGLNARKNGIVQLACIIEINGDVKEELNYRMNVFPDDQITDKALEINHPNQTPSEAREAISGYTDPLVVHSVLTGVLKNYINPYKKGKTHADKFYPAGYKVPFDIEFVDKWFKKCGDNYFGSWQNWHFIDPMPELHKMELKGEITLENYKLETVCEYFGIEIDAHDALSDIRATRQLIKKVVYKQ